MASCDPISYRGKGDFALFSGNLLKLVSGLGTASFAPFVMPSVPLPMADLLTLPHFPPLWFLMWNQLLFVRPILEIWCRFLVGYGCTK